ncbi:MAG: hypothetical protein PVH32_05805, partial [Chromatiales bacterium]
MQRLFQPLLFLLFLLCFQQAFAADDVTILNAERELEEAANTIASWDRETTPLDETEQLRTRLYELQVLT